MTDYSPTADGFDPTGLIARAWATQDEDGNARLLAPDLNELVDSVAKAHRKDRRLLARLNLQEIVATVIVAGFFGYFAPSAGRPAVMWTAVAIMLFPAGYLVLSSIRHDRADSHWDTSIRSRVAARLEQVRHRARLYRTVGWWYFAPFVVAIALVRYSAAEDFERGELPVWAFVATVFGVLYWFNRRVGRTRYEPEVERLESILADFGRDTGFPTPGGA